MRTPMNSFDADDLALCRAHGNAVDESREARALLRWADATAPLAAINLTVRAFEVGVHMPTDPPLPPSYWDDLEHWLKTLAPAKPAAEQSEADKPAQQPAQKASTHLVCIEAHSCKVTGKKIPVGRVSALTEKQRPDCWLPCDESGWVTHVPTADSVCPVPDGVQFKTRLRNGKECNGSMLSMWDMGYKWDRSEHAGDITAWRPVAAKVAE